MVAHLASNAHQSARKALFASALVIFFTVLRIFGAVACPSGREKKLFGSKNSRKSSRPPNAHNPEPSTSQAPRLTAANVEASRGARAGAEPSRGARAGAEPSCGLGAKSEMSRARKLSIVSLAENTRLTTASRVRLALDRTA